MILEDKLHVVFSVHLTRFTVLPNTAAQGEISTFKSKCFVILAELQAEIGRSFNSISSIS